MLQRTHKRHAAYRHSQQPIGMLSVKNKMSVIQGVVRACMSVQDLSAFFAVQAHHVWESMQDRKAYQLGDTKLLPNGVDVCFIGI